MAARFVAPDFLNLGVGPFAPRGAMGLAPRVAFLPVGTVGTVFAKVRRNQTGMLVNAYLLPLSGIIQGQAFSSANSSGLSPNPYEGI